MSCFHLNNNFNFDCASFYNQFCEKQSDQVMIYGFKICKYIEIIDQLKKYEKIKKVYDFEVGINNQKIKKTAEGREIEQIEYNNTDEYGFTVNTTARACKSGLTNIVLENYKRRKENLSIIHVVFSIDCDENEFSGIDSQKLTTRSKDQNARITHKEIRRAYKLCYETDPEIQQISKETFYFAKLKKESFDGYKEKYSLVKIDAPWEKTDFYSHWKRRMENKASNHSKKNSWKVQLEEKKNNYDKIRKLNKDCCVIL